MLNPVKIILFFAILKQTFKWRGENRMIVQITGNVKYSITLDPNVWIFDDRKILFEDAFANSHFNHDKTNLNKVADRWRQEVFQQKGKPPVNKTINRFQKEKVLNHSYVMPIKEFLSHAEVNPDATDATLQTTKGNVNITLKELQNSL